VKLQSFSVEFFPPKDNEGEERLWAALAQLKVFQPDFISVTYGAGGSTRDRTIRITEEITKRTGIDTVAHLTCVGSTKAELAQILNSYKSAGIQKILALRGDPTTGPTGEWIETPGGFTHAVELVKLAAETKQFEIGVAAFPDGHPASQGNFAQDLNVLLEKIEAGATFATTQFFFDVGNYEKLANEVAKRFPDFPIIAGILPITNYKQLNRMAELSGAIIPESIRAQLINFADDAESIREIGVEIATQLGAALITSGVPGLHFYTMNSARSTLAIAKNLNLIKTN
jgi:methylenetetrahydrofolate reductase (NADPH)